MAVIYCRFLYFRKALPRREFLRRKLDWRQSPPTFPSTQRQQRVCQACVKMARAGRNYCRLSGNTAVFTTPPSFIPPPPTFCLSSVLLNRAENPLYRKSYTSGVWVFSCCCNRPDPSHQWKTASHSWGVHKCGWAQRVLLLPVSQARINTRATRSFQQRLWERLTSRCILAAGFAVAWDSSTVVLLSCITSFSGFSSPGLPLLPQLFLSKSAKFLTFSGSCYATPTLINQHDLPT